MYKLKAAPLLRRLYAVMEVLDNQLKKMKKLERVDIQILSSKTVHGPNRIEKSIESIVFDWFSF